MTETIRIIIFGTAIVFIGLSIFSLTIGQILPYEFADYRLKQKFYDVIIHGLPISILLTLFGTIKRNKTKTQNFIFFGLTVLTSILSFFIIVNLIFRIDSGAWITVTTIYRHKTKKIEIKEQWFDVGALGYGGQRIVKIKTFVHFWVSPTPIDTLTINKNEWEYVNEQGEIKFP